MRKTRGKICSTFMLTICIERKSIRFVRDSRSQNISPTDEEWNFIIQLASYHNSYKLKLILKPKRIISISNNFQKFEQHLFRDLIFFNSKSVISAMEPKLKNRITRNVIKITFTAKSSSFSGETNQNNDCNARASIIRDS